MSYKDKINKETLPKHVAIIMDGNGRWAKEKGLDRVFGHKEGVESVRTITEAAAEIGIRYLTLYTFSQENWNRPIEEVEALMSLLVQAIEMETPTLMKNNVRLQAIGSLHKLPPLVLERLQTCIKQTAANTGLTLVISLSYSSREEILMATQQISADVLNGKLSIESIDADCFSSYLMTSFMPDPDLLIRTSGESRISNFLLWQIAYTELYFTPIYWPDFKEEPFFEALYTYQNRERRFGKISEQLKETL